MKTITFKPSRTFGLAVVGLLSLALLGFGLFAALVWTIGWAEDPLLPGRLITALQVVAGSIATVASAGAGSMAARDWRSRGLTSSQGQQVLASQMLARPALEEGDPIECPVCGEEWRAGDY